ncbi:MAG: right-handed parallel beta-helix repeat-containing protein [Kiritimatiellae bacterium]|nr:right-handed parallel beta-helix repeat-containing protein [Kiritimatiellia bacterium]MDD5521585.1 right-handed parallel beta-helix repeat-containing protein [Kiritimatiellia bacterium]
MSKICDFFKISLMIFLSIICIGFQKLLADDRTFFVATNGNDTWSGKLAEPNADKTDGPMASINTALEASRKQTGTVNRIVIGAGRFYLEKSLALSTRDSELTIEGAGTGKTIIYGGRRVIGWKKDGEHFWAADIPEVKEGKWDFRALVVNDRLCLRARLPETGRFEHETKFPVRWMSSAGGGWERKPTQEELTTMQYRAGDLGNWLSVRNAEITVYHMWDESMIGVAAHDPDKRILTFSTNCIAPPGAFNVNTYVVWNIREGMKTPGQWYLDRDTGRIVYWPLPGEDMEKVLVVAPCVETIIEMQGQKQKPVRNVTLRSLTLSTTTTPCKPGSFGASAYRGAVQFNGGEGIRIIDVEITNIAGNAIRESGSRDVFIENCHIHHIGAGACRLGEGNGRIVSNSIHHIGLLYPSAIGLMVGGRDGGYAVRRNEIHHTPYSGMCIGGVDMLIEENLIHHCMQELHDGAAIYGGPKRAIVRRNVVRDIVEVGKGYGASSYYMDEKARDCVVEENVSIGVRRPCHNHMTLNCVLRNNVFICDGDMEISFARSCGGRVTGNILQLNGKLKINDPDAIVEWSSNLIVQAGEVIPVLSDAMPVETRKLRETPVYANVMILTNPPVIDGKLDGMEWPSGGTELGELPDQKRARGAPLMAKLCADKTNLYIGVVTVSMFPEERKLGHEWGKDEGMEFSVEGKRTDGQPVTYVFRGFTDGKFDSLSVGGASETEAKTITEAMKYSAVVDKQVWRCEWCVPFEVLRFAPTNSAKLPMNVTVYRSENNQFIQWAGTSGETWDLKRGGRLVFPKH